MTETEMKTVDRHMWNMAALQAAAQNGITVEFRYAKDEEAPIETRRLSELECKITADRNVIVTGLDPDREHPRSYRVDRIKGFVAAIG